ncbi:hypothetical protein ACSA002_2070 [Salmonella phage vB_SalM_SA002]|nr:hypothetical protein ACSA002_2070 [Salmonella phage vB_SalM_SA002]
MNLYLVERIDTVGWDEYSGMIVAAASEDAARLVHPSAYKPLDKADALNCIQESAWCFENDRNRRSTYWVFLEHTSSLRVTLVGTTHLAPCILLLDFNAG